MSGLFPMVPTRIAPGRTLPSVSTGEAVPVTRFTSSLKSFAARMTWGKSSSLSTIVEAFSLVKIWNPLSTDEREIRLSNTSSAASAEPATIIVPASRPATCFFVIV